MDLTDVFNQSVATELWLRGVLSWRQVLWGAVQARPVDWTGWV